MDKYIKFDTVMSLLRRYKDEHKKYGNDDTYYDLLVIIDDFKKEETVLATALEQAPTWIPVSERLPETSEDILILLDDYKNMSVGRYYAADGEWYADFGEGPFDGVVAWMPLPEPMKKVSLEPWEGEADGQE